MKPTILISFFFISLISCSTDKIEPISSEENILHVQDQLEIELKKKGVYQDYSFSNEYDSPQDIKEKISGDWINFNPKTAPLNAHGPFTITVPVPNPNPTDVLVIYRKGYPPAVGTYITDVYNYKINVKLPSNAVYGYVESVQTEGYSDYMNQTIGFNFNNTNENGSLYLKGNTYTMILKQNLLGQVINLVKPAPSGPKTFTYYYYTP